MLRNFGEFSHLKSMISTHTKDPCEETDPINIAKFLQKVPADSQNTKRFLNICTFVSGPMFFCGDFRYFATHVFGKAYSFTNHSKEKHSPKKKKELNHQKSPQWPTISNGAWDFLVLYFSYRQTWLNIHTNDSDLSNIKKSTGFWSTEKSG